MFGLTPGNEERKPLIWDFVLVVRNPLFVKPRLGLRQIEFQTLVVQRKNLRGACYLVNCLESETSTTNCPRWFFREVGAAYGFNGLWVESVSIVTDIHSLTGNLHFDGIRPRILAVLNKLKEPTSSIILAGPSGGAGVAHDSRWLSRVDRRLAVPKRVYGIFQIGHFLSNPLPAEVLYPESVSFSTKAHEGTGGRYREKLCKQVLKSLLSIKVSSS